MGLTGYRQAGELYGALRSRESRGKHRVLLRFTAVIKSEMGSGTGSKAKGAEVEYTKNEADAQREDGNGTRDLKLFMKDVGCCKCQPRFKAQGQHECSFPQSNL